MLDFNKIFDNSTNAKVELPKELVEYLSKKNLPNSLKYIPDENGYCVAVGKNGSLRISGFEFCLSHNQELIIGKDNSISDVLDYAYNSQSKIELKLKKEGFIIANGEEVPINKLIINPFNSIKKIDSKFFLIPPKFPKPFHLKVGNGKYERELLVSRVASNEKNIMRFKSEEKEPFVMNYSFDVTTKNLTVNFSFSLKYAKHVKDIVESTMIYNSIIDGKGLLNDYPIGNFILKDEVKKFDERSAIFWEKVLKLEKFLDVAFIPPMENISFEIMCDIETLYQNLIEKVPIRDNHIINKVNCDLEQNNIDETKNCVNKPLYFQFKGTYFTKIFDVDIELPAVFAIFNSVLKSIENNKTIVLGDEDENKKRYTVIQCFKTEQEIDDYMNNNINEIVGKFKGAKKPFEYIN